MICKLKNDYPKCNVSALTVDEGIDGYRDESIELTRKITKKYHIPHAIVSFKDVYGITLDEIMKQRDKKGTSVVEIVSNCNSGWKMTPVKSNIWLEENMLPVFPLGDIKG